MSETPVVLEQRDDSELVHLSRASRAEVAKQALAVLGHRDHAETPGLVRDLVTGHPDPRVRSLSATMLGRMSGPETRDVLVGALADAEPSVVRRAAQSLGRIGDEQSLAALVRVRSPQDPVAARALRAATTLLSYRHGIPVSLVAAPETTRFSSRRPTEITFGGRTRVPRATVLAAARRELPDLTLTEASVRPFTCSDAVSALVVDPTVGERGLAEPRLLGALLRERACSDVPYSLDAYLLSDDRDATAGTCLRLWLMRPSGRVVHAGTASVDGDSVTFLVNESVAPYGNPVRIAGSFGLGKGRLVVSEALVGKPSVNATRAVVPALRAGSPRQP